MGRFLGERVNGFFGVFGKGAQLRPLGKTVDFIVLHDSRMAQNVQKAGPQSIVLAIFSFWISKISYL